MPRITTCGAVLSTATKLYLITSTVATGVGGGFFVPRCFPMALPSPSRLCCSQKQQSCSYGSPYGGVATPPQYFRNGRAEICPNPYARGDCTRPCYAGRRSVKREPCIIGKRTVSPGRFFRMDCRSRPWVYRITERIFPTSRDCRFVELVFPLCVKDVDRSTP